MSQNNSQTKLHPNQNLSPRETRDKRHYYIDKQVLSSVSLDSSADNSFSQNDINPQQMIQTFGELTHSESHETFKKLTTPNTKYSHSHQNTLNKTP